MEWPAAQLETLVTIVDTGSFEAAARELQLTPSAVSQRVRALEAAVGRLLVVRRIPCTATEAGAVLVRLGRQNRLLRAEAMAALGDVSSPLQLPVVVNADSLATWFRGVLAEAAGWDAVALLLQVDDQGWTQELLRSGQAVAAVTSEPQPVHGCSVEPLGRLRYVPAAAPTFVQRWRRGRSMDWSAMPMVIFNEKDRLQHEVLAQHDDPEPPVVHQVPTSADFVAAVCAGLGWAAVPEPQLVPLLATGELERLPGRSPVDVALHWQRWRMDSAALDRLTEAVRAAAAAHLRRR